MPYHRSGIQLIDDQNRRKYIDQDERLRFIEACYSSEATLKCFGLALLFTGGRISEVLSICDKHVEVSANRVRIKTLKRRHSTVIRHVPLPTWFIDMLSTTFDLKTNNAKFQSKLIWPWSRSTASRKVKHLMELADIIGKQASAKGLRHGFGCTCNILWSSYFYSL